MKPRLLDLFCGAGGAAMGYHRAGFEVVGVDIKPQKNYPFEFNCDNALDWIADEACYSHWLDFDVIHASPPCQHYTKLKYFWNARNNHPDLVVTVRNLLKRTGIPWVIENVYGSPLNFPAMLCGHQFGLKTFRHRYFESPWVSMWPEHKAHPKIKWLDRYHAEDGFVTVAGNPQKSGDLHLWKEAMGINWMTGAELSQAIPPAYTEWIGRQLLKAIGATNA